MDALRIPLIFLAAVQGLLVFCGGVISLFADSGFWWERIPLLLHPPAAVFLVWLALRRRPGTGLAGVAVALLALSLAGSAALTGAIRFGWTRVDWWLPLVWAVIPAVCLPYAVHCLGGRRDRARAPLA